MLRQPPGLTTLGCQGSACDRLRLTGRLRAFAQGSYEVSLRWRGGRPYGRHFLCRLWRRKPDNRASPVKKPYNRPAGDGDSPFGGWRHHLARWEACHWIRGSRGSPMNPVPLPPPQFGGAAKGKRLNGQARRLTSPHLEVLCRTSTVAL